MNRGAGMPACPALGQDRVRWKSRRGVPLTNDRYLFSKDGWDINIFMEKPAMNGKWFTIGILALGFFLSFNASPSLAQKSPKTLTLVYSNNINGEIDPCPT
jgi:hypothetical protein